MRFFLAASLILTLTACAPAGPGTLLLAPDPARAEPRFGADGPYGAALWTDVALARGQERVALRIVAPATEDGALAPDGPFPALVLNHGARVSPERYDWLAAHLASRGFVVVAPAYGLELPLPEAGNAQAALDHLEARADGAGALAAAVDAGAPAGLLGHSLGGVAAAAVHAADRQFRALVLLASYPAGGAAVEERDAAVLSLCGDEDAFVDRAAVREGLGRYGAGSALGWVEGLNHYGWADDVTDAEAEKEPPPSRAPVDARLDAQAPLDAYLDLALRGDIAADAALRAGAFPGVDWSRP
jgi:dienelactone hydrolase